MNTHRDIEMDKKVTIGIPVFNAGKYLKFAIDSVLGQTYQNFEIIISIDGSTDDSADIVKKYNDPRISLISEKENKGIAYRLNQQIKLAKGEFFARMDADDIMFPDRIEKQVHYMIENPTMDVIGGQAIVIDDKNEIIGYRVSDQRFNKRTILYKILFIHPTVFGTVKWFRDNPYSSEYDGVEDYYLWNTSFPVSNFRVLDLPLLFYRDPPSFNNKTYLERQKKLRKAIIKFKQTSVILASDFFELYSRSVLKTLTYSVLFDIGLTGKLIKSRNEQIAVEKLNYFSEILKRVRKNSMKPR
jgi:glycosyltransferase involved in cell wall biosynthesis